MEGSDTHTRYIPDTYRHTYQKHTRDIPETYQDAHAHTRTEREREAGEAPTPTYTHARSPPPHISTLLPRTFLGRSSSEAAKTCPETGFPKTLLPKFVFPCPLPPCEEAAPAPISDVCVRIKISTLGLNVNDIESHMHVYNTWIYTCTKPGYIGVSQVSQLSVFRMSMILSHLCTCTKQGCIGVSQVLCLPDRHGSCPRISLGLGFS